ncbi:MAG TPA: transcriptional regulator [Caulobacterales bacterium]|nr:transcriptional regulator [Caulobacterales bacterium]
MDGVFRINNIDELVHGRMRLGIMAFLAAADVADFNAIRDHLQTTDGNLSVHLRKLEDGGYVKLEKTFVQRRSLTRARLTRSGRAAFVRYLDEMAELVSIGR